MLTPILDQLAGSNKYIAIMDDAECPATINNENRHCGKSALR